MIKISRWHFTKSQIAAREQLPERGSNVISVRDEDKENILLLCQVIEKIDFKIYAKGTTFSEIFNKCTNDKKLMRSPHIVEKHRKK